jgi:hypothetical protein
MTTDTDITNKHRASWAAGALMVFMQETHCDLEDSLGDLLCDLMHWAGQNHFDFAAALNRASDHYEAELLDERPLPSDHAGNPAPEVIAALEQAVAALNTAPRFRVPLLDTDSYRIAALCDRAIAKAKGGA